MVLARDLADSLSPELARRLVSWPLALAAGYLTALAVMHHFHVSRVLAAGCGLLAAWLATRVRDSLEARLAAAFSRDPTSVLLSLSLDIVVGAGVGYAAGQVLESSVLAAVGVGAGLAGLWSFVVVHFLAGGGVDSAVDFLLQGSQSAAYAEEPILADGEALEREGHVDGAIRKYREVARRRPREVEAYLRAARLLAAAGHPQEAMQVLRDARQHARLTPAGDVLIGRQLAELAAGPLDDPAAALAELTVLAHRYADSPAGQEAARDAEEMRATIPS